MAVKFRHKKTGLFFCKVKDRSPSLREVEEIGSYAMFIKRNLSRRGRIYESATEKQKQRWIGEYTDEFEIVNVYKYEIRRQSNL